LIGSAANALEAQQRKDVFHRDLSMELVEVDARHVASFLRIRF
jgi:hypothetical protein